MSANQAEAVGKMVPRYFAITPTQVSTRKGEFTIGIEKMGDVIEEIKPLHQLHWDEVEVGTPLKLNLAYDKYIQFEQRGQFALFTVRNDEHELVGYFMCYIQRANHAQGDFVAREDALFLRHDVRGSGIANKLLDYISVALKQFQCKTLSVSSRHDTGGTNLTHWLAGRGFRRSAVVFVKEL